MAEYENAYANGTGDFVTELLRRHGIRDGGVWKRLSRARIEVDFRSISDMANEAYAPITSSWRCLSIMVVSASNRTERPRIEVRGPLSGD